MKEQAVKENNNEKINGIEQIENNGNDVNNSNNEQKNNNDDSNNNDNNNDTGNIIDVAGVSHPARPVIPPPTATIQNLSSSSSSTTTSSTTSTHVPSAVSRMGKRKYKDNISLSMFGTTTIAGRYKKMKPIPTVNSTATTTEKNIKIELTKKSDISENIKNEEDGNNNNNNLNKDNKNKNENGDILVLNAFTAGQCLIRLNFFQIFQDKMKILFFSDSIKRRLSFENLKKIAYEEYETELRRRKIEEMSNLRMLRTQNMPLLTNGEKEKEIKYEIKNITNGIKIEGGDGGRKEVVKEEVDSFEALLGAPQDLASFSIVSGNNNINNNNNNNSSNGNNNLNYNNLNSINSSNINNNNSNTSNNIAIKKEKNTSTGEKISEPKIKIENNGTSTVAKKTKNATKKPKIVIQMEEEED